MLSIKPVESFLNLQSRVMQLLSEQVKPASSAQFVLDLDQPNLARNEVITAANNVIEFLDLITASAQGDVYLFGGVLRDLALYGKKGFTSDIDIVVDGDWSNLVNYIEFLGARKNKFGGYRLKVGNWPVDIWNARDTWAIKQAHVAYTGIASLLDTTVLNWDAVLMNWRTANFVARPDYLKMLQERTLHVVFEHNPNPLGMTVRVFRHLCMKDARRISVAAANYLARCTRTYTFNQLQQSELKSYGRCCTELAHYQVFRNFSEIEIDNIYKRWEIATEMIVPQRGLWLHDLIAV